MKKCRIDFNFPSHCFLATCIALMCLLCSCRQADYGLCIISSEGKIEENSQRFFPMHSIVKFPQALYVADYLYGNDISLDSAVVVHKDELMQDTWSPMLEMMDDAKEFSFRELLLLSLTESDNNACDLLFGLCGNPQAVDTFIKGLGFEEVCIAVTERQMHEDPDLASLNCCTPAEMVKLFLWFNEHWGDNAYLREVWNIMASCNTGIDRIPAAFEPNCKIIHKTGTGFNPEKGLPQMNDAGIVISPDGNVMALAAFVPHPASTTELSEIIRNKLDRLRSGEYPYKDDKC